jgi:hypothetical protein
VDKFKACEAVVGIPVRNEQEHIEKCLLALASQVGDPRCGVLVLLNNCMDDTSELVQRLILQLAIPIDILSVELPPELAHAGYARQLVMQKAAELARDDAVLMTTDADARVASNWLSTNLSIIREGVDVVAGRTEIDLLDAARIPRKLHEDDARECRYAQLVDEIHALLDPDSADPWPRHTEHSGASLTVTMEAYRRAEGYPQCRRARTAPSSRRFGRSMRVSGTRQRCASSSLAESMAVPPGVWPTLYVADSSNPTACWTNNWSRHSTPLDARRCADLSE